MAGDFIGVPSEQWWRIDTRSSDALWIAIGALALAVLIVLKLIQKGVIGSWADLLAADAPA